jgi:hypothetical protein
MTDVARETLYRLLDVAEHRSHRELVRRARNVSPRLPQLIVSAAARENVPLGTGTRDELRRARARAARYADLYDAVLAAVPAVRLTKGPSRALVPAGPASSRRRPRPRTHTRGTSAQLTAVMSPRLGTPGQCRARMRAASGLISACQARVPPSAAWTPRSRPP